MYTCVTKHFMRILSFALLPNKQTPKQLSFLFKVALYDKHDPNSWPESQRETNFRHSSLVAHVYNVNVILDWPLSTIVARKVLRRVRHVINTSTPQ